MLSATAFLSLVIFENDESKQQQKNRWTEHLTDIDSTALHEHYAPEGVIKVHVGVHVEAIKELNLKTSCYQMVTEIWFRWYGDKDLDMKNNFRIFAGRLLDKHVIKEVITDSVSFQLLRCEVQVTENYSTDLFPLDAHQLLLLIESDHNLDRVVFVDDRKSGIDKAAFLNGFNIVDHRTYVIPRLISEINRDPTFKQGTPNHISQFASDVLINRSSFGLYFKCFIALFATTTWVLVVLYLSAFHKVDPIGMIPGTLFGTVANLMVGASLLPDALTMGLVEYVNLFGIGTILGVAVIIIKINALRNKHNQPEFAHFFGLVMFYTVVFFVLVGHVIMPCSAFLFNPIL